MLRIVGGIVVVVAMVVGLVFAARPPAPRRADPLRPAVSPAGARPVASGQGVGARDPVTGAVIPTSGGSGRPSAITHPIPWQYDPASNQHWHEEHWHWHDGQPPAPDQRTSTAPAPGAGTGIVGARAADGSVIPTSGGSGRPSNIKNPTAWQYDPESNQHWHEGHWHWHDGPPPPENQRQ